MSRYKSVFFAGSLLLSISLLSAQDFNYAEVLQKSMWFYEVQRSGPLPANNRVEWRGSSAVNDGSDVSHDLTGGWYDAGDNMKFNFPMSFSVTMLAWGGLENPEGYQKCGQWGYLLSNIKWVTDYLVKCHTAPNEFYGQIGQGMIDHKWWGAPEVFPNPRPAFKIDAQHPGSDLAAEAAAALASSSMLFKGSDPTYATTLLTHAKQLFDFADQYRGLYSDAITDAAGFYKSWSGYQDELVWASIWLYLATEDQKYLTKAENWYDSLGREPQTTTPKYKEALSWDDKTYGCYVLLAKITNKQKYHTDAERWLDWWSYGYSQKGGSSWNGDIGIAYTPSGLAWIRDWGPIRYSSNVAFAALAYSQCKDLSAQKKDLYTKWAKSQIDYALGNNEQKRSYVCGFGENPPVKPHHRSMHGPYLDDNGRTPVNSRHILYGALVGGPGKDGSYVDDRLDATKNEVATDYNAGFSSTLAGLVKSYGGTPIADFPQPAKRDTEYTVVAKINTAGEKFTEVSATVENKTTWPARYSQDLTMKYFVNLSEVFKAGLKLSDVVVQYKGCGLCSTTVSLSELKQYPKDTSLYYVEIAFNNAEKIAPAGQSAHRREVQFRIGIPDSIKVSDAWDPKNDPSFAGLTDQIDSAGDPNITVYEKGILMWGKEPDGTSFVPQVWARPDIKEPSYSSSTWNTALLKGTPVRYFPVVKNDKSGWKIAQIKNGVSIQAINDICVGLYTINGKLMKSYSISKGTTQLIDLSKMTKMSTVMKISGANGTVNNYLNVNF